MASFIIVAVVALVVGIIFGLFISAKKKAPIKIDFEIRPADMHQASLVKNKEEIMVIQQITITSLVSLLSRKDLTPEEEQYVLKAIEVAELIPGV